MTIAYDFSDWPEALYAFSLAQITHRGWIVIDPSTSKVRLADNANNLRISALAEDKYAFWSWWIRFSTGVECLVKAVFIKHEKHLMKKKQLSAKAPGGSRALATKVASQVYSIVCSGSNVTAKANPWLQATLAQIGIEHPLEIDSGTLGEYRSNLIMLTQKGVISTQEQAFLEDALLVLGDIRRNTDAHIFIKLQIGGSINGDLENVYIPACNMLIEAFSR